MKKIDIGAIAQNEQESKKDLPSIKGLDLNSLRLEDPGTEASVKLFTEIPVRKPRKQEFFRIRSDEGYTLTTRVLEAQEEGEFYAVDRSHWDCIGLELKTVTIYTAINRQNTIFLIPVTVIPEGGRRNRWSESLLAILDRGKKEWVRAVANLSLGVYEPVVALEALPEPEWPETVFNSNKEEIPLTFEFLFQVAFGNNFIDSLDHPVVKRLHGRV